jgi:hypothetical protein
MSGVAGLFENLVGQYIWYDTWYNDGVGAQYNFITIFPGGLSFGAGEAAGVGIGRLAGGVNFLDLADADGEGDAGGGEKLAAAGGLGGEDEGESHRTDIAWGIGDEV